MKNTKSKLLVIQLALCIIFNLLGCTKNMVTPDETAQNQRIWILSDFEKYEKLMQARAKYDGGTPFEIRDLKRNSNKLKISVEGGCLAEEYKVYWDGKIDLKEPVTAKIIVSHEPTKNLNCFTIFKGDLEVDMFLLIGKEYDSNMRVKVSNASKVADLWIDKDGKVNSKN
jgi:hypothetical protein